MAEVAYTDIDYRVFSEAAESVTMGLSPYAGRTELLNDPQTKYRYSPLLAYALVPNIWLHPCWGKILFSALDVLAVWPLTLWLRRSCRRGEGEALAKLGVALWLLNPFTFTISTRGSCESIVVLLLYSMLAVIDVPGFGLPVAAALFGLAVHFRIYPIVYALPLLLHVTDAAAPPNRQHGFWRLASPSAVLFGVASGATFVGLLLLFYAVYGMEFVNAAYLHHGSRVDTQHNFSVYFYPFRFYPELAKASRWIQLLGCAVVGWIMPSCAAVKESWRSAFAPVALAPALLVQSLAFVALNSVVTAQYFVWWLSMLPAALPWLVCDRQLACSLVVWALAEVHWLLWAYLLEFRKLPVAPVVWLASCVFFAAHLNVARTFLRRRATADVDEKKET
eukprot:TRINITY_DN11454_c0_g1_i2.p1 TRINITY_DN11454_c0_g1~~TRINITY_DN11454_c0_g1_i2.p1  ORF type:complete len:392 (-),score=31.52 TRINITY_DN11454_c0_g1_i2:349-1524(-)